MMKALRYISAAFAVIGLAACQSDDSVLGDYSSDPSAVRITASVGNTLTRSFPTEEIGSGKATQFKVGDKISVSTEDQGAATYVLDADNTWKPLDPNAYLIWNKESHTFTAYYPADTYSGDERTRDNQNGEKEIADADYMSFTGEFSNTGAVNFTMERQTARVVIDEGNFSWGNQYVVDNKATHEVKEVRIHANDVSDIVPYKVGTKYYALVNPGAANPDALFVSLRVGPKQEQAGTEETLTVLGIPELAASTSYNFQITVGKDKAELGKVTLEDWIAGDIIDNGQALDDYVVYQNSSKKYIYDIYTLDGLLEVNKILSAPDVTKEMLDAQITLHNDFVLPAPANGEKGNWKVIGNEYKPFRGDIIGNNHTIYGLVIDSDENGYDIGMFGDLNGGIKDLTLVGCKVKGNGHVGGFVGYRIGSNEIQLENCTLKATKEYPVVIESTDSYVGGIVGSSVHENLVNCSLICEKDATITIRGIGGNAHYIGGIAGRNDSGTTTGCKVINNGGKIEITNAEGDYVAGLIGKIEDELHSCSVSGATITGRNHVGGLLGYLHEIGRVLTESKVEYCTITGQTNTSATYGSKHANSYWTPKITVGEGNTVNGVAVTPSK